MDKPYALIIDDDRDIVALFRHVLDIAGYRTEIILHGKTAIERLKESKPDIVLLDLTLPVVSGTEILHFIRSDTLLANTKVVVITGHAHIAQSLEDEPDLVLLKPVNIEQLSELVQRLRPTEKAIHESPIDEKTGCYNRSFFISRMDYGLARLKQIDLSHFTMLLIDLDRFQAIELERGMEFSKTLLQEAAKILRSTLRPTDTIARFDGAQFAIMVEDVAHWDIPIVIGNRIQDRLRKYLQEKGLQSQVDIGIILCHAGYVNVDEILRDANAALALAKSEGGRECKFYARDTLNNAYDISMMSEVISLAGAERVTNRPMRRSGLLVRNIDAGASQLDLVTSR